MDFSKLTFHPVQLLNHLTHEDGARASEGLFENAQKTIPEVLRDFQSSLTGLSAAEATRRLECYGSNTIAREKPPSLITHLINNFKNPLILLLLLLGIVSLFTGDWHASVIIFIMAAFSIILRLFQEMRSDHAAEKLKAMVRSTILLLRDGEASEVPIQTLVPGDIVQLASGDMIPADLRILSAKDLFVNQAALTGEALPIEKTMTLVEASIKNPLELSNICFMGSNIESGSATAIVIHTGERTYLGSLAASLVEQHQLTSFDKGVNQLTWLMIRFMIVMVPAVFLINGLSKHNWVEAFLFAMAVAVGLTPELLPMIVIVNLSKGALAMARKRMIVKRLYAIQNFGAMDVLCTDKTGTITQGKIILEKHLDAWGRESEQVLHYGYLNSYYHTGLKNLLDDAIRDHEELEERLKAQEKYRKIDEIPFDFVRRRMSVVVEDETGLNLLICKGAVQEVMEQCHYVEKEGTVIDMQPQDKTESYAIAEALNREGFRTIAVAYKRMPGAPDEPVYTIHDESDLVLLGFLAFLDPPKETTAETLQRLKELKVDVKILTGDNEIVTSYICGKVGISVQEVLLGPSLEMLTDTQLAEAVEKTSVFARLLPAHKERILHALQARGHVVGFLGDGINDAPALKAADVGISVDSAVDIAKESSDLILLENSLLILEQGVKEGRKVFGNIIKYIKMATSSNFGNMFSVVGASAFLPFLPMLPIQVLLNNLLYDFSQSTIPTDTVDADWLKKPRKWAIKEIRRFILFIGPISSIFDYATFFMLLWIFNCWQNPTLFHSGWFVESIFTQTLIIHVIRTNKIPFIESRASWPLLLTSILIVAIGAWLTISPFAPTLGLVPLPPSYWGYLGIILISYTLLTQKVKTWFIRKFGET